MDELNTPETALETARLSKDLPVVPRLGLATRGNTHLTVDDVLHAFESGVRYFNWCGKPDGLSRAISELGPRRKELVFATQLKARNAERADRELDWVLEQTGCEWLDIGTLYYVESDEEWCQILDADGAWNMLEKRRREGQLGLIGLTSHQRRLAATWASEFSPMGTRRLHMLMIRYNAAHTGAEEDIFPVTRKLDIPVVSFTALRWCDLLRSAPDDPTGSQPPSAVDCYRFCLANPHISVVLSAPNSRDELNENLTLLDCKEQPDDDWLRAMRQHGRNVHRSARQFW